MYLLVQIVLAYELESQMNCYLVERSCVKMETTIFHESTQVVSA